VLPTDLSLVAFSAGSLLVVIEVNSIYASGGADSRCTRSSSAPS